jgi:hypothetical protein
MKFLTVLLLALSTTIASAYEVDLQSSFVQELYKTEQAALTHGIHMITCARVDSLKNDVAVATFEISSKQRNDVANLVGLCHQAKVKGSMFFIL